MDWNCAPTCIGSLPHKDPAKALDLITSALKEIPFWPQLPAMGFGENMYAQFSTKLPGVRIDAESKKVVVDLDDYDPERFYTAVIEENVDFFAYDEENFHGFYELMRRTLSPGIKAVKGQVTGPISTGLQIFDQTGKSALYDDFYGEIIRKDLNLCAKWQESKLKEKNGNVIMFLDEPSLSLVGTPFAPISRDNVVLWIDEVLDGLRCVKGLHCCGNTDWPMVLSTNIDLLSFDAYSYAFSIALYPKEVKAFLDRGGVLSWGIIPNMDSKLEKESVPSLVKRLEEGIDLMVSKGIDRETILRQSMLTPQCGLGGLDEAQCGRALALLNGVSDSIRKKHRLGE
ncbi:MAG: methionine synthase [Euryarchaeota archaeon]|nr:methionine synthase [Euryarchaeota archaeon]